MKSMTGKILFTAIAVLAGFASAEACTTWVIHASASKTGRIMVNKCRDNTPGRVNADIVETARGRRFLRLGEYPIWAGFGMNDKGVVVTCNDGDALTVAHRRGEHVQINSPAILRQVLAECDNAWDGAVLYRDHCRAFRRPSGGKRNNGSTLLVADPKRAFLIDVVGPGYCAIKEIYGGIAIISNCMHLPGAEKYSRQRWPSFRYDRRREANVRRELKKGKVNGKYTIADTMRVSRLKWEKIPEKHFPFRKDSLGGTTFEIDTEFPGYLSTAYIALGPQQHTVYLPTPMALTQFPETIRDGSFGELACALRKAAGDDHAGLKKIVGFEKRIFAEYEQTREQARKLLREKRTGEAVQLLNACYLRQFRTAEKLLTSLRDEAVKNTPAAEKPAETK